MASCLTFTQIKLGTACHQNNHYLMPTVISLLAQLAVCLATGYYRGLHLLHRSFGPVQARANQLAC